MGCRLEIVSFDQIPEKVAPEYLRGLATFGAISDETIQRLLKRGRIIALASGEELYHLDAKVREFYIVLTGKILLYHHYKDTLAMTRGFLPGEQIGFVSMIALHDRKGTAIAEEVSYLLEVTVEQFFELRLSAPDDFSLLLLNLTREMARSIGRLGDRIAELQAGHLD